MKKVTFKEILFLAQIRTLNHVFERAWVRLHPRSRNPVEVISSCGVMVRMGLAMLLVLATLLALGTIFVVVAAPGVVDRSLELCLQSSRIFLSTRIVPLALAMASLLVVLASWRFARSQSRDFVSALQTLLDEVAKHWVGTESESDLAWLTYEWASRVETAAHALLLVRAVEKVMKERAVTAERDELRKQKLKNEAVAMHDELVKLYDTFKKIGMVRDPTGYRYLYRAAEKQLKQSSAEPGTA